MGPNIIANSYHVGVVRGALTRNLGALFPEVQEEVSLAFQDHIPAVPGRLFVVPWLFAIIPFALLISFRMDKCQGSPNRDENYFPNFQSHHCGRTHM